LARLDKLRPEASESPMGEDLIHLARSEVFDTLGDKTSARRELEAVTIDETTPVAVVEVYYRQADAFYRQLDDREALVALCRRLSSNSALRPDDQLHYARAAVRAMVRGLSYADADARLARERTAIDPRESELAFAIDLGRDVLAIRDAHAPRAVGDALLALYGAQTRAGRRRTLIVDAVQRADDVDADDVLDALVQRDIGDVPRATHERGEAEDVFERLILARAYERANAQRYREARDDFDSVAAQTGSLEAIVGAIDMALNLGEPAPAIEARYDGPSVPVALANFAKAYLIARRLPKLEGSAHATAAKAALKAIHDSWSELEEERLAQALFGALLHEEYLQTGDLATAERANVHYLIALELVGDKPRLRAMVLGELGLLHTDVGNYRIAFSFLLERERLPSSDDAEGLDVLLSKAQALLHVGREREAAAAADSALDMIARRPVLAPYRLLALDWAAVDHLAAGDFARSLALYDREIPLLESSREDASGRTRMVLHLARAAAAVGGNEPARALVDLDAVDRQLKSEELVAHLQWPHATTEHVVRAYRLIASGLRASANGELQRWDAQAAALNGRRAILEERLDETNRSEIEREQMLAEAQLALNASQRRDAVAAGHWLELALSRADDLRTKADGASDRDQLDVLRLAAWLSLSMTKALVVGLPDRIESALRELRTRHEPSLRAHVRWFE
ncbi:MAG TPA: hypothetical protein VHZ95_00190, partial [Polyangiales bacterium]|nr:hypothetical protein [Polyangiales bacterium]